VDQDRRRHPRQRCSFLPTDFQLRPLGAVPPRGTRSRCGRAGPARRPGWPPRCRPPLRSRAATAAAGSASSRGASGDARPPARRPGRGGRFPPRPSEPSFEGSAEAGAGQRWPAEPVPVRRGSERAAGRRAVEAGERRRRRRLAAILAADVVGHSGIGAAGAEGSRPGPGAPPGDGRAGPRSRPRGARPWT
jgi:hypothetical protein